MLRDNWLAEFTDFGTEKVFETATNYSAIIQLGRADPESIRVAEADAGLKHRQRFAVGRSDLSSAPWFFQPPGRREIFETMRSVGSPLSQLVVRFGTGLQTGADKILTLIPDVAERLALEESALVPFIRGRDVRRYGAAASKVVVFPYRDENGWQVWSEFELRRHPAAFAYLSKNQAALRRRVWFGKTADDLSGAWYGHMYVEDATWLKMPHLLTPSLSGGSNFALGTGELFATGTAGVTSVIPKTDLPESIFYLLGVLNSRLLSAFAVHHSSPYQGGYFKFSANYLKHLPIRRIDFDSPLDRQRHDGIASAAESLCEMHNLLAQAATADTVTTLRRRIRSAESEIDALVGQLYGIEDVAFSQLDEVAPDDGDMRADG